MKVIKAQFVSFLYKSLIAKTCHLLSNAWIILGKSNKTSSCLLIAPSMLYIRTFLWDICFLFYRRAALFDHTTMQKKIKFSAHLPNNHSLACQS